MKPNKILIFGRGQLGTFYKDFYEAKGAVTSSPVGDIRDDGFVASAVRSVSPDLIINCAAKTNIDWCEMNKTDAFEVNTLGADVVAKVADENGV